MKNRKTLKTLIALVVLQTLTLPGFILAQQAPAADITERLRKDGMENSQVMKTLHRFTDVYGPRLTGSPNLKAAGEWAMGQMKTWGFDRVEMEPWDFGHPGWTVDRASGFITSPVKDSLVFEVLAWTPGTNGSVSGPAVRMILPQRPTQQELTAYFDTLRGKLKGAMVMFGNAANVRVNFDPPAAKRIPDDVIKQRFDPENPTPGGPPFQPQQQPTPRPDALTFPQINEQVNAFLVENGVAVRINDAGREHGQIRAFSNNTYDVTKVVPTVVMRNEDFGRIVRLLDSKIDVSLEFDIRTNLYPEGATSYNTIGEIAGSDKKDEVIMLGGHLDSWHSATGATDNAIGCSVMMEAARILKASGIKPRRTIRVALWSGEEQGLLGSQAYVKKHFGTAEAPTADYFKFGGYFNIDSGTGRARGFTVFGPPETAISLRETASLFVDWGVGGANVTRSRNRGGSDHTSFNEAGLPGISVTQDPVEYFTHTWHTNLDTYERISEDDVKKSAIIIAAAVYKLAMADELLPRFKAEEMPPLPVR